MGPLKDYSFIRGFNYTWGEQNESAAFEETGFRRHLGYAKKIGLNSMRVQLHMEDYERDPKGFLDQTDKMVSIAFEQGIRTTLILFNGVQFSAEQFEEGYQSRAARYIRDTVHQLKDNDGLLLWDIMNNPSMNNYILQSPDPERSGRWMRIVALLKNYVGQVRGWDSTTAVTIGHTGFPDVKDTIDEADVISFHNYYSTSALQHQVYQQAKRYGELVQKPLLICELGAPQRANPYDRAIYLADQYHVGWFVFQLMISGYWGSVQGIFYEDGTVRDPSAAAAVLGIYRNRETEMIPNAANRERAAEEAVRRVKAALAENTDIFDARSQPIDFVLDAAEFCANLLEANQLVPMNEPPTVQIEKIRKNGNSSEARRLAYRLAKCLEEECFLFGEGGMS